MKNMFELRDGNSSLLEHDAKGGDLTKRVSG